MYFQLYTDCIIVKGAIHDAIYDLHSGHFLRIKKRISKLLIEDFKKHTLQEVRDKYPDWNEGIDAYIKKLTNENLAFLTREPQKFPPLNLEYHSPFFLDNAIVHLNKDFDFTQAILELMELDTRAFQLVFDNPSISELQKYINLFKGSIVRRVDVLIRHSSLSYADLKSIDDDLRFVYRNFNINELLKGDLEALPEEHLDRLQYLFNSDGLDLAKKEVYGVDIFTMDLKLFIEAKTRNIGLNKKVCIDKDGNIKNYISHDAIFGNVKNDKIYKVVSSLDFQKKWFIDNSQIEKCKGCIYRMMCYSCSDIEERDGILFKKDDCHYDPVADHWTE